MSIYICRHRTEYLYELQTDHTHLCFFSCGSLQSTGMVSSIEPLVVGRVVGDVVDMFVPSISMSVHYGSKRVANGCEVKPSMAVSPPTVQISGLPTELYTIVICFDHEFVDKVVLSSKLISYYCTGTNSSVNLTRTVNHTTKEW